MAVLKIDGADMPTPSVLAVGLYDISSTADRNAQGTVVIDRVAVKRKLECTWKHLTGAQLAALLTAAGANNIFFEVTYPDPQTGAEKTITAYVGDRSTNVYRVAGGGTPVWTDVKMNFIEK